MFVPRWGRIRKLRISRVPPYAILAVSVGDKTRDQSCLYQRKEDEALGSLASWSHL